MPKGPRRRKTPSRRTRPEPGIRLMRTTKEIAKSKAPIRAKTIKFAENARKITIATQEGIITREVGQRLIAALQKRAAEAFQIEAKSLAYKGAIRQEFLKLLESMVEKRLIGQKDATKIASDYLGSAIDKLGFALQKKTPRAIFDELERIKEILEIEAERRGFDEKIRNTRMTQLRKRAFEGFEEEARKAKPRMDYGMVELIDRALEDKLINKGQELKLKTIFAETNLNAMIEGKTSTIALGRLDPIIWGLPEEERKGLLKLRERLREKISRDTGKKIF